MRSIERHDLPAGNSWRVDERGTIARHQSPLERLSERATEHRLDIPDSLRRQLRALLIQEPLDVLRIQLVERDGADRRLDVEFDDRREAFEGSSLGPRLERANQPVIEERPERL